MNIIHIALNAKHNEYIQFKNIAMNLSRIFVDKDMGIHLLYLPIEVDKADFSNLEKRVKRSIASAIVKNKEFMNPVVMSFYNELSNNDKNLNDIKELLEKMFSEFIDNEQIIDLVSNITLSDSFNSRTKNTNQNFNSIEKSDIFQSNDDLNTNRKEVRSQEVKPQEVKPQEVNNNKSNNFEKRSSDYNTNTNDKVKKDNNALFSNSIMNRLDEIVNKIKDKKTEDTNKKSIDKKTSNNYQVNNNENQNIVDVKQKMNVNQVTNQSNELYNNNFDSGNYQVTNFFDDDDGDSTAVLGEDNSINQVDTNTVKRPVLYGIENIKGISIEINKDEVIIGSKDNMVDVMLVGNKTVSRCHCKIIKRSDIWYIQDLGSTNGTYINDNKIPVMTDQLINEGDVIRISNYSFIVRFV